MKYLLFLMGLLYSFSISATNVAGEPPFVLKVEQQLLEKGNEYTLEFRAANTKSMIGYQFAIELTDGIRYVDVIPGEIPFLTKNNFACQKANEQLIFTNWFSGEKRIFVEDELVFTIKVKAEKTLSSVDALLINHHKMATEAYKDSGEHFGIELLFTQNEAQKQSDMLVFPNPVDAKVFVQSKIASGTSIELLSPAGTVLNIYQPKNYTLLKNEIDLSNMAAGIYLLRWENGENEMKTEKILKL